MIKQNSNINEVIGRIISKVTSLEKGGQSNDSMLREIATTMRGEMSRRIHSEGRKSDGSDIGQYSKAYGERKTRLGKNQLGKVNLSFTGQMSNQFQVIATTEGYGIGWSDEEKIRRAGYLEERYGKVWGLSEEEKTLSVSIAEKYFNDAFSA